MAIFRITDKNLRSLKSLLMSDFEMKSGHCDEAIAALCGFQTYASMRHAIGSGYVKSAVEVTFDGFEGRCFNFSYDRNSSEYLKLIFNSLDWPDFPWITFKFNEVHRSDSWYFDCEKSEFPIVRVRSLRKYRTLEWDCITLTTDSDQHTRGEAGDDLVKQMHTAFQLICRGVDRKAFFDGSAFCGEISGLSEFTAGQLANLYTTMLAPTAMLSSLDGKRLTPTQSSPAVSRYSHRPPG